MQELLQKFYGCDQPTYRKVLMTIGLLWSIRAVYKFLKGFDYLFMRTGGTYLGKKYGEGSWAVVTGATDGLGKEFATRLAKMKFNIVLVSRTPEKLAAVAEEIKKAYGVEVKTIAVDFSRCHTPGFFDKITEACSNLDIGILVNNVGIDSIERFDELSVDYIERTMVINCWAGTMMTRHLVPNMAKRKRSAVINLASMIGLYPAHHYNIYSASKAFTDMLSLCLSREYNNVDFISVCPSEVSTPMTGNKPVDIWTITTKQCVDWVFNDLNKGYVRTEGHWKHKMQSGLTRAFPCLFTYLWEQFIMADMRKERRLPPPRLY